MSRLLAAVREVLGEALVAGGTSFDDLYVNVNGESGYFERSLAVYGREGFPCLRCGTPVRRDPFMNRSAYSCPRCQPRPRRARSDAGPPRAAGCRVPAWPRSTRAFRYAPLTRAAKSCLLRWIRYITGI